ETSVSRQLAEDPELSFARVKRGPDIFGWEPRQVYPRSLKSLSSHLPKSLVIELADIFAVEPGAFVQIKGGIFAMNFCQVEKLNDLREIEFFPIVLWRPAEQTEIITNGFGQVAALDVSVQTRALVALTHLRAIV